MSDRISTIIDAAARMFSRYGYAKTTMGDIAVDAGVARQTVYNAFSSKDDVLRAVVRSVGLTTMTEVKEAWKSSDNLGERFRLFQELGPVRWFETVQAAPDSSALIDGLHSAAAEALAEMEAAWHHELCIIIDASDTASSRATVQEVVEFFYSASINAKHGTDDVEHLRRRLKTIRDAALALLDR